MGLVKRGCRGLAERRSRRHATPLTRHPADDLVADGPSRGAREDLRDVVVPLLQPHIKGSSGKIAEEDVPPAAILADHDQRRTVVVTDVEPGDLAGAEP